MKFTLSRITPPKIYSNRAKFTLVLVLEWTFTLQHEENTIFLYACIGMRYLSKWNFLSFFPPEDCKSKCNQYWSINFILSIIKSNEGFGIAWSEWLWLLNNVTCSYNTDHNVYIDKLKILVQLAGEDLHSIQTLIRFTFLKKCYFKYEAIEDFFDGRFWKKGLLTPWQKK